MSGAAFLLIPLIGYASLWLLGSSLFVVYFRLFGISIDVKHVARMLQRLPVFLAILTVPVCSFASFFTTAKLVLLAENPTTGQLLELGAASLGATVVLDVLITVVGEKVDVRVFPVNLMYLFAWLVIIPAIVLGGR